MDDIKEYRRVPIENRIIKAQDLKKLGTLILREYDESKKKEQFYGSFKIKASCSDSSVYESQSLSLFDSDSVLSNKRVDSVTMQFSDYREDKSISFEVRHGYNMAYNNIEVDGRDSLWVNGVLKRLEDIIKECTPQSEFVTKHKTWLLIVLSIGLGSLATMVIVRIFELHWWNTFGAKGPLMRWLIQYAVYFYIGLLPASNIIGKLHKLWPSVEVQVGPEHMFSEKRRRAYLVSVTFVAIVPLVINIITKIVG